MKASEIILQDSESNGVNGQQLLNGIASQVKNKQAILMQENDSVLVMSKMSGNPHGFTLHLFTADAPLSLAKALTSFIKKIRNMKGVQSVYGSTDNPQLLELLRRLDVDVLDSDLEGYTWMAKV